MYILRAREFSPLIAVLRKPAPTADAILYGGKTSARLCDHDDRWLADMDRLPLRELDRRSIGQRYEITVKVSQKRRYILWLITQ